MSITPSAGKNPYATTFLPPEQQYQRNASMLRAAFDDVVADELRPFEEKNPNNALKYVFKSNISPIAPGASKALLSINFSNSGLSGHIASNIITRIKHLPGYGTKFECVTSRPSPQQQYQQNVHMLSTALADIVHQEFQQLGSTNPDGALKPLVKPDIAPVARGVSKARLRLDFSEGGLPIQAVLNIITKFQQLPGYGTKFELAKSILSLEQQYHWTANKLSKALSEISNNMLQELREMNPYWDANKAFGFHIHRSSNTSKAFLFLDFSGGDLPIEIAKKIHDQIVSLPGCGKSFLIRNIIYGEQCIRSLMKSVNEFMQKHPATRKEIAQRDTFFIFSIKQKEAHSQGATWEMTLDFSPVNHPSEELNIHEIQYILCKIMRLKEYGWLFEITKLSFAYTKIDITKLISSQQGKEFYPRVNLEALQTVYNTVRELDFRRCEFNSEHLPGLVAFPNLEFLDLRYCRSNCLPIDLCRICPKLNHIAMGDVDVIEEDIPVPENVANIMLDLHQRALERLSHQEVLALTSSLFSYNVLEIDEEQVTVALDFNGSQIEVRSIKEIFWDMMGLPAGTIRDFQPTNDKNVFHLKVQN